MLTSASSQYYHDYLQPLPPLSTPLDSSKKSPLALLAQTCNSIGKDSPPSKSALESEKKDRGKDKESSRSNSTTSKVTEDRRQTSPVGNGSPSSETAKGEVATKSSSSFSTPPPKDSSSGLYSRERSSQSPTAEGERSEKSRGVGQGQSHGQVTPGGHTTAGSPATSSSSATYSNSKISLSCGNVMVEVNHRESSNGVASKPRPALSTSDSLTTPVSALPPGLGAYTAGAIPLLGHPLAVSLDPAASSLYHAGLSAHHLAAASAAHHKAGGAASPYVSYTTVRTASGASTLVPLCKDPHCTQCQISLRTAQMSAGTCPAGCLQCNHDKTASGIAGLPTGITPPAAHSGLSGLSALYPGLSDAQALRASLYPHMYSVLPGQHSLPNVCNWVVGGSEHCGKRFASSEELMTHLRTHMSAATDYPPLAGLPYSSLALHSLYSGAGSVSPSALRPGASSSSSSSSSYPRSLSPTSLLSASRYHPYKAALSSLPAPSPATLPPSALAAYYSPYSLYAQRIGAAAP